MAVGFDRGIRRCLLFLAVYAALASSADAFFGNMFNNLFGNLQKTIQDTVQNTMAQVTNSILSGVGGLPDGATRSSVGFAGIIDGAFSRKNGIFVGNLSTDMDWAIDSNKAIGAIFSRGGGASVSVNGNLVNFGKSSGNTKGKSKKKPTPTPSNSPAPKKTGPKTSPIPIPSASPSSEPVTPVLAIDTLMGDWDAFMKSEIWDAQEGEENNESTGGESDMLTGRANRMVNGLFFAESKASGSEFQVKLFYDNEKKFYCSGSLIGYPYVLTAAHCGVVKGDQVRVGGKLLRSGYKATVDEVYNHPDFERSTLKNDITVLKLAGLEDKKTLMNNGVFAARINRNQDFPNEGSMFVLSGHGSTEEDGSGYSEELLATRQTVHKDMKCAEEITQGELTDDDAHLCAGDGMRSTSCVGDSGGGLWRFVTQYRKNGDIKRQFFEIVGVVSFGEVTDDSMCPRGPPTVYQEVSIHAQWITDKCGGKGNMA